MLHGFGLKNLFSQELQQDELFLKKWLLQPANINYIDHRGARGLDTD